MKLRKIETVAFWLVALTFLFAAIWTESLSAAFPLAGLRSFASHPARLPLSLFFLGAVLWLTLQRRYSRDGLLVLSGVTLSLAIVTGWYVSYPFGLTCLLLFIALHRSARERGT